MAVQSSTRKWVFIGGGVIAAAALVVLFQNYPPQPKDAAGTIGAAQRYHEPQITGADVAVSQDELTTWIQSDTFDRILKDPQARKLFADAATSAMISDAALKFKLQDAGDKAATISEADAVKLGRFIAVEDASRVEVTLSADAVRTLSEMVDANTRRTLMEAAAGDQMRKFHFLVAPDLALKFKLIEAKTGDPGKFTLVDAKTADANTRLSFTPDEVRRIAVGAQDYSRRLSLPDADTAGMRYVRMALTGSEANALMSVIGGDAALKFKLIEAKGYTDASNKVELALDADTASRLRVALGGIETDKNRLQLSPADASRVALAIESQFAHVKDFSVSGDAVRLMNVAFSNANISAALNNADFVRAFSSNQELAQGLVARTRSEYIAPD